MPTDRPAPTTTSTSTFDFISIYLHRCRELGELGFGNRNSTPIIVRESVTDDSNRVSRPGSVVFDFYCTTKRREKPNFWGLISSLRDRMLIRGILDLGKSPKTRERHKKILLLWPRRTWKDIFCCEILVERYVSDSECSI